MDGDKDKSDDVELLGGSTEVAEGSGRRTRGPTLGENAPLFQKAPDTPCAFSFAKGSVVIEFDKPVEEVELDRQQAVFFVDLLATHARQLRANSRTEADADGESPDLVAKWKRRRGKIVLTFKKRASKHAMTKPEAQLLIGHLRAEIRALPILGD